MVFHVKHSRNICFSKEKILRQAKNDIKFSVLRQPRQLDFNDYGGTN